MRKMVWIVIFLILGGRPLWAGDRLSYRIVNESRKVHPKETVHSDNWLYDSSRNRIKLLGAKNETVSFQIILRAGKDTKIEDARIQWETPGSLSTSFFYESYLFAPKVPKKIVAGPAGNYPDPLIPFWDPYQKGRPVAIPFLLKHNRNQPIWVDIQIPRSSAAGIHRGTIQFSASDGTVLKIGVQVRVWNFVLPRKIKLTAWVPLYWERLAEAENLDPRSIFLRKNWPVILRYYQMAHNHGFVTQITNGVDQPEIEWDSKTGKMLSIDWSAYDSYFDPILSGKAFGDGVPPNLWKVGPWLWWGMRDGDKPFFGDDYQRSRHLSDAHKRALRTYVQAIEAHFAQKDWTAPELFVYLVDEPDFKSYPQLKAMIRDLGQAIHEGSSRVKNMATVSPGLNPELVGGVDIWATTGGTYWVPSMQKRQAKGEKAWFYQEHEPFVGGQCLNQNGLSLRTWPWIAKRYGVDGIFLWVGDFWPKHVYTDAVNWNDSDISNGILFYPGNQLPQIHFPAIDGPVSSFRMKELRRGMQDYAYFQLAGKGAEPIVRKIIRSALNPREISPYWDCPRWAKPGDWSHNPEDWENARQELARQILEKGK